MVAGGGRQQQAAGRSHKQQLPPATTVGRRGQRVAASCPVGWAAAPGGSHGWRQPSPAATASGHGRQPRQAATVGHRGQRVAASCAVGWAAAPGGSHGWRPWAAATAGICLGGGNWLFVVTGGGGPATGDGPAAGRQPRAVGDGIRRRARGCGHGRQAARSHLLPPAAGICRWHSGCCSWPAVGTGVNEAAFGGPRRMRPAAVTGGRRVCPAEIGCGERLVSSNKNFFLSLRRCHGSAHVPSAAGALWPQLLPPPSPPAGRDFAARSCPRPSTLCFGGGLSSTTSRPLPSRIPQPEQSGRLQMAPPPPHSPC